MGAELPGSRGAGRVDQRRRAGSEGAAVDRSSDHLASAGRRDVDVRDAPDPVLVRGLGHVDPHGDRTTGSHGGGGDRDGTGVGRGVSRESGGEKGRHQKADAGERLQSRGCIHLQVIKRLRAKCFVMARKKFTNSREPGTRPAASIPCPAPAHLVLFRRASPRTHRESRRHWSRRTAGWSPRRSSP